MNFHLDFQIPVFSKTIHYSDPLFFMGSCFAENIAAHMQAYKFNTLLNPHGILYNPQSIASALHRYIKNESYTAEDLFYSGDSFHSWEHHSRFSHPDAKTGLSAINEQVSVAHQTLKTAGWLFITFGSAYVYRHRETGKRVGNCHKQPLQDFTKELLTMDELETMSHQLMKELGLFNPGLKIIFTVSPVRYIRDGIVENNLSKARLIELVHRLTDNKQRFYFPAYELVIDDLRDYRFYKEDLVHPNEQAIAYIFEKFIHATWHADTKILFEKIKDILKARSHKPFQQQSTVHQKFKAKYFDRCRQLQEQYPFLSLNEELNYFS